MKLDRKQQLKVIILAPLLALIIAAWFVAACFEQGYYYLKGYSWDPVRGGYWHRETGYSA